MSARGFRGSVAALGALASGGALALGACSGPPGGEFVVPNVPTEVGFGGVITDSGEFKPGVSDALELRCGTLDCHGNSARNLRVYGRTALRLSRDQTPGGGPTSDAEYQATYSSLIAIQPEVLSGIVADRGARPERWIVITKGRGTEHHKGGGRMVLGDDMDRCLLSWLAGAADSGACSRAASAKDPWTPGL